MRTDDEAMETAGSTASTAWDARGRRPVLSWALYDLANTIFQFSVVSYTLPLWVKDEGGSDAAFAVALSIGAGLMFFASPVIGAVSDQVRRRMPFLIASTLLCCACTFFLGTFGLVPTLVIFVLANFAFQAGSVFYDTLLPAVSTDANRGRVSGLGVGIGYFGSFLALGTAFGVLAFDDDAKPLVFKLTALLFIVFALPCFLWVKERPRLDIAPVGRETVRRAFAEVRQTVDRARQYPDLPRFLAGRVFYSDASNTLVGFMGIYVTEELGFSDGQSNLILGVGILGALIGGLTWGRIVDKIGPKATLNRVLALWAIVMASAAAIAYLDLPSVLFWVIAPLAGVALGGTGTADRPLMIRLSPPRYLGQFYGLYGMAGRFAAIVGPLLWALIVDGLELGRPAAVLSLLGMIAIGYVVLRPVNDARRAWTKDEAIPDPGMASVLPTAPA
jgi:UMF1 family MFS transporter